MSGPGRIILVMLLLLLSGCAAAGPEGQKGGLVRSDEVRALFESNTVLPDHVYYFTGPEAEPEAIIGIQRDFALQGRYWYQVALSTEQLQAWNRMIDNAHRIRSAYSGARIMAPDGRQAGVWYSRFDHTVIRFPDEKTVLIYTPGPSPSDRFHEGDRDDGIFRGPGPRN